MRPLPGLHPPTPAALLAAVLLAAAPGTARAQDSAGPEQPVFRQLDLTVPDTRPNSAVYGRTSIDNSYLSSPVGPSAGGGVYLGPGAAGGGFYLYGRSRQNTDKTTGQTEKARPSVGIRFDRTLTGQ